MKSLVVYSSMTGNTKKVAEAIYCALPDSKEICDVKNVPQDLETYDIVFAGFWVDRGMPDNSAKIFLEGLLNKNVALFATLGAPDDSKHAQGSMKQGRMLLNRSNNHLGDFLCRGKVNEIIVEQMAKKPATDPHSAKISSWQAMLEESAKHPNADDLRKAGEFAVNMVLKFDDMQK